MTLKTADRIYWLILITWAVTAAIYFILRKLGETDTIAYMVFDILSNYAAIGSWVMLIVIVYKLRIRVDELEDELSDNPRQ